VSGERDQGSASGEATDGFWRYFHELYEALPRQGPGERASTERALGMLPGLGRGRGRRLLDVGCGSGMQTLDVARATEARIVAVDDQPPSVARLARRVAELGLGERITTQVADMRALPFADGSFDVIWAEGSISIIGFAQGLARWRRLLEPGGHLVVSELCSADGRSAARGARVLRGRGRRGRGHPDPTAVGGRGRLSPRRRPRAPRVRPVAGLLRAPGGRARALPREARRRPVGPRRGRAERARDRRLPATPRGVRLRLLRAAAARSRPAHSARLAPPRRQPRLAPARTGS